MRQMIVPVTFLHPGVQINIASARVRGLDHSPYPGDQTQRMDELWLEKEA